MSRVKRVSVVTVCFNAAETIADTLTSVAAQRGVEVEHIVIDGGSTDNTMAIVARYPHVAIALSEPDKGLYDAMNKGLDRATGDLVGFLNADDFFSEPDALAAIADAGNGMDAVVAGVAMVDQDRSERVRRYYGVRRYRPWMLALGHMPPHPTFYARPELLVAAGRFNDNFRIAGDFDLILRLFRSRPVRFSRVDRALVGFRHGGVSTQGLKSKATLTQEVAQSLAAQGYRVAKLRAAARYLLKLSQYLDRPGYFSGHPAKPEATSSIE